VERLIKTVENRFECPKCGKTFSINPKDRKWGHEIFNLDVKDLYKTFRCKCGILVVVYAFQIERLAKEESVLTLNMKSEKEEVVIKKIRRRRLNAKDRILNLLKRRPNLFVSEVAQELKLAISTVSNSASELWREGKIEKHYDTGDDNKIICYLRLKQGG